MSEDIFEFHFKTQYKLDIARYFIPDIKSKDIKEINLLVDSLEQNMIKIINSILKDIKEESKNINLSYEIFKRELDKFK